MFRLDSKYVSDLEGAINVESLNIPLTGIWNVDRLSVHGICILGLVYREVLEVPSNCKRSYLRWLRNRGVRGWKKLGMYICRKGENGWWDDVVSLCGMPLDD